MPRSRSIRVICSVRCSRIRPRAVRSKHVSKGLADIVLAEGKMAGCSYTDVRFTMTSTLPGATVNIRPGGAPAGPGAGGFGVAVAAAVAPVVGVVVAVAYRESRRTPSVSPVVLVCA